MALFTADVLTKLNSKPNKKVSVSICGKAYDIFIKNRTVEDYQKETAHYLSTFITINGEKQADPSKGMENDAYALSNALVDDKGEPLFTIEQLMASDKHSVFDVLLTAYLESLGDDLSVDDTAKK